VVEIELREGGPPIVRSLADASARPLGDSGIVTTVPLGANQWQITAGTKIGAARVGDVLVRIQPKVDIHRVLFLLGYARNPGWQERTVPFDAVPDLVSALAHAFAIQAERAVERGLLQGYVEIEDASPVLRGRLREQDQVRQRYGIPTPLLVRYDDYTVDIAENRLLRAAADRLLRVPGVEAKARRQLRGLLLVLGDVSLVPRGSTLPAWRANRLNTRYHVALHLAEIVLRDNAVDHLAGSVRVNGFLVDMAKVFEDFVTTALGARLGAIDGSYRTQPTVAMDIDGLIDMRPDLVWYADQQPRSVVDAKYKAEKPSGFPNADLYQLLAYCTVLDVPVGHLIYAKGNETPVAHRIQNTATTIIQHTLDLDTSPTELLAQVAELATHIGQTAHPTVAARTRRQLFE
jgi:5-methylcytosine-specific restriction enzyme subunit McrC